jgi:DNA-binding response OmpR family regulator
VRKRVLIVDDDPTVTTPVVRYFRSLGHTVHSAAEAEEAGALIATGRYDAAIFDLRLTNLGGAEGLELLREIRERDAVVRVVVLSAYVSAEARAEALRLGATCVLQKPHPLPELARLALGESIEPREVKPNGSRGEVTP